MSTAKSSLVLFLLIFYYSPKIECLQVLPGVNSMGIGIDATTGIFANNPIFKFNYLQNNTYFSSALNATFLIPDEIYIVAAPTAGVESFLFLTATEYSQFLASESGFSLSVPVGNLPAVFRLSADVSAVSSNLKIGTNAYLYLREYATMYQMRVNLLTRSLSLNPDFLTDLGELPSTYDAQKYELFIKLFGTHVMVDATFGGLSEGTGYIDWDYLASSGYQSAKLNAKLTYSHMKAGIGASYTRQASTNTFQSALLGGFNHNFVGGTSTLSIGSWSQWVASVPKNPIQVRYRVLPLWNFVADPTKRLNLEKAIQNYIQAQTYTPHAPPQTPDISLGQCGAYTSNKIGLCQSGFISGALFHDEYPVNQPICSFPCLNFTQLEYYSSYGLVSDSVSAQLTQSFSEYATSSACQTPSATMCGSKYPCLPGIDRIGVDAVRGVVVPQPIFQLTYAQGNTWQDNDGQFFSIPDQVSPITVPPSPPMFVNISRSMADVAYAEAQQTQGLTLVPGVFGQSSRAQNSETIFLAAQSLIVSTSQVSPNYIIQFRPVPPNVTDAFARAASNLPLEDDMSSYQAFIEAFGTHVVVSGTYGGLASLDVVIDESYFSSHTDTELESSVKFLFASFQKADQTSTSNQDLNMASFAEFQLFGGIYMDASLNQPGAYDAWVQSTKCNPAQVSRVVIPITELINDQTKRGLLQKYINAYFSQNNLPDIPILPKWGFNQTNRVQQTIEKETASTCYTASLQFPNNDYFSFDGVYRWISPYYCVDYCLQVTAETCYPIVQIAPFTSLPEIGDETKDSHWMSCPALQYVRGTPQGYSCGNDNVISDQVTEICPWGLTCGSLALEIK